MLSQLPFLLRFPHDELDLLLVDGDVDLQQPSDCIEWVAGIAEG